MAMQDKVYVSNPAGSTPNFTADLYFSTSAAGLNTGDLVVDALNHVYTVSAAGTVNGAKREGVGLRDDGKGGSIAPGIGYGMCYTPTPSLRLSQPPLIDVAANQTALHMLDNADKLLLDGGGGGNVSVTKLLTMSGE